MDEPNSTHPTITEPEATVEATEPKPKARAKKADGKGKAKVKAEAKAKTTPKAPQRNMLYPFRASCNADVAWRFVLRKLRKGQEIDHEDVAKGFQMVDDGKGDMAESRAANFLPWCHKHGMLDPVEGKRGTYVLSAELKKLLAKESKAKSRGKEEEATAAATA